MNKGFTLIELLIVVAIIGILAAIAVPNFLNAQMRAKHARAQAEMKGLGEAYTMYKLDNNAWPPHLDGNPAQHKFVTSPIAYFSSSIADIFVKGRDFPGYNEWFLGQYHAEPGATHHGRIQNAAIYDQTWNVAFFMTSVGPSSVHEPNIIFDASNGLQSNGDILHFTYGEYKKGYPFAARR